MVKHGALLLVLVCLFFIEVVGVSTAGGGGDDEEGHGGEAAGELREAPVPHSRAMTVQLWGLPLLWVLVAAFGAHHARAGAAMQAEDTAEDRAKHSQAREVEEKAVQMITLAVEATLPSEEAGPAGRGSTSADEPGWPTERNTSSFLSAASCARSGISLQGKSTVYGTIINIITGGLGSGILCLPWATAGASLATSITVIGGVLALNAFTIGILIEAAAERRIFDIGALLGQLPSKVAGLLEIACNAAVWVSMFLCLIGYFIVIADCTMKVLAMKGLGGEDGRARYAVLLIAAVAIAPLCFLDQDRLALTSSMTVAVNIYIFGVIGMDVVEQFAEGPGRGTWATDAAADPPSGPLCVFGLGLGAVSMCATMMQCVIIQMCVLPMYAELQDPSPEKFKHIIYAAFSGLFLLFTAFAEGGLLAYGNGVEGNVLVNLGTSIWHMAAQGGMVLAIMAVYPIMLIPMVAPIKSSRFEPYSVPIVLAIELLSCLAAFFMTDLGFVNIVNGSMCVGIFVGLIPALIGFYINRQSPAKLALLAAACLVVGVLGLIYSDNRYPSDRCFLPAW